MLIKDWVENGSNIIIIIIIVKKLNGHTFEGPGSWVGFVPLALWIILSPFNVVENWGSQVSGPLLPRSLGVLRESHTSKEIAVHTYIVIFFKKTVWWAECYI